MNNVQTMMEQDAGKSPRPDQLQKIRASVARLRDMEYAVGDAEERLKLMKAQKRELEEVTIPTMMMQVGINSIGLDAEGNLPAYDAEIKDRYSASIAAGWDDDRREAAFDWMIKNKLSDLLRTEIVIDLVPGQQKLVKKILPLLKKLKVSFVARRSVHHMQLTSAIRELFKSGKPLGDKDLKTLGASVGKIVKLKAKKE